MSGLDATVARPADTFASPTAPVPLGSPASPPLQWLGLAGLLLIGGFVVFLVGRGATMGVIGWVLAGPLAISVLGLYTVQDAKRAQTGWYRPSSTAEWGRRIVIVAALVVVALNAFLIANDVARGMWR